MSCHYILNTFAYAKGMNRKTKNETEIKLNNTMCLTQYYESKYEIQQTV